MEHPCYKCGAQIEEGLTFCPNCNAPQIRVGTTPGPAANEPATRAFTPGTPGEVQPPAQRVDLEHRQVYSSGYETATGQQYGSRTPQPERVQWADALPGALLAGVIVALCWMMPLLGLLLWPLVAGLLATLLYARRRPETTLTRGMGARVGAMAGLFGFIAGAVVMVMGLMMAQGGGKMRQALEQMMQQKVASNPSPEAQAMMQKLMTPEGLVIIIALSLLMFFALFVASGAAGGAIGAALARKKNPPVR